MHSAILRPLEVSRVTGTVKHILQAHKYYREGYLRISDTIIMHNTGFQGVLRTSNCSSENEMMSNSRLFRCGDPVLGGTSKSEVLATS